VLKFFFKPCNFLGWAHWQGWSQCTQTKGDCSGTHERIRECVGGACDGPESEEGDCKATRCGMQNSQH